MYSLKKLLLLGGVIFFVGCASEMPRGSSKQLYTIASVLTVYREDIGKDIQLTLDQSVLFDFDKDPARLGDWRLLDYDSRTLIMLSETPKLASNHSGALLRAKAPGSGWIQFAFIPYDESKPPEEIQFDVTVKR